MVAAEDFVRGFKAAFRPPRGPVVVLHGYFDDTNTHGERGRPTAVAGFLFEVDRLTEFTDRWADLTSALPKPFRAADCYHGNGQFRDWPVDDRRALHMRLARLIGETRGPGFYAAVDPEDYHGFLETNPLASTRLASPFALCLLVCLQMIGDHLRDQGDDRSAHYWFEMGSPGEKQATDFLRRSTAIDQLRDRYRVASYHFVPKGTGGLVPADFLAWEMQRNMAQDQWSDRMLAIGGDAAPPVMDVTGLALDNLPGGYRAGSHSAREIWINKVDAILGAGLGADTKDGSAYAGRPPKPYVGEIAPGMQFTLWSGLASFTVTVTGLGANEPPAVHYHLHDPSGSGRVLERTTPNALFRAAVEPLTGAADAQTSEQGQ